MDFKSDINTLKTDIIDSSNTQSTFNGRSDTMDRSMSEKENERKSVAKVIMLEDYEEKFRLQIAGEYIVLSENRQTSEPYLVYSIKSDNPFGVEEPYHASVTSDYLEAIREFINRADAFVTKLESERTDSGLPVRKLTAADCLPDSNNTDWKGNVIVVKPETLSPEYQSAEHQLAICTGGFGASPNSRGNAVFVKELYSGNELRYERYHIAGIADPSKLPVWAADKLAESIKAERLQNESLNPEQSESTTKKPSLLNRLKDAKTEAVVRHTGHADASKGKTHIDVEVD